MWMKKCMGHRSPHFSGFLLMEVFSGSAVKGHIAPLRENSALPWYPCPQLPSHPIFPRSVSTPHSPSSASIIKYPTLRNLNNVTQMEKKASRPFFSQSLAVSTVPKVRREKSPGCSLPTTLTYSLDKLWEIKHFHNHYNNWCCSSSCLSYDKWWAVLPGLPYVRSLETFQ